LERSWQGTQLRFKLHLNRKFAQKVMGFQKLRESQFWEFRDSHLGVSEQNDIWMLAPWPGTQNTIRGKVRASFNSGPWWVLWIRVYHGDFVHQKCSNYALTNLLFGLCRSMWMIDLLVNLFSPKMWVKVVLGSNSKLVRISLLNWICPNLCWDLAELSWFHPHSLLRLESRLDSAKHGWHPHFLDSKREPLKFVYPKCEPPKPKYSKPKPLKLGPPKFQCSKLEILKLELSKCQPLKVGISSYQLDDGLTLVKHR